MSRTSPPRAPDILNTIRSRERDDDLVAHYVANTERARRPSNTDPGGENGVTSTSANDEKQLSELQQRLLAIEAVAKRAEARGDKRLNVLLRNLELDDDVDVDAAPSPRGGVWGGRFSWSSSSSDSEFSRGPHLISQRTSLAQHDPCTQSSEQRLSAARSRALDAVAIRLRDEFEEDRREREDVRRELDAMRAAMNDVLKTEKKTTAKSTSTAATSERPSARRPSKGKSSSAKPVSMSLSARSSPVKSSGGSAVRVARLEAELREARAAAEAAIELAADNKAAAARLRAERRWAREQMREIQSSLDEERSACAAADRELEEVRGECARAWERVAAVEEELARKSRRLRSVEEAAAGTEQDLRVTLDRCSRGEALVRELRREGHALVVEAAAVSRRCKEQDVVVLGLKRRNADLEVELRTAREHEKAQREDIAEALHLVMNVPSSSPATKGKVATAAETITTG